MHGGRSTGPRTPRGKRRVAANALKHGLYAAYLSPAELGNLAQLRNPDLSGEVALLRALVRRALEWAPGNPRAWAQLAELVGGLVGRVGRLVETRARLRDPKLVPLHKLLVPLLESGQLGKAVEAVEESGR